MTRTTPIPDAALRRLRRPIALTRLGLAAERGTRAFWPFVAVLFAVLAALMFGLPEALPLEVVWIGALGVLAGLGWALVRGIRRFHWPTRRDALDRLDRTLPGRPIAAIRDHQAIGAGDTESEAVWTAHVNRMAERAARARAVRPDLKLATRDPYALRYAALLAFVMALIFGSIWRVAAVTEMAPGAPGTALAAGPAWEGWIEPPTYTGLPGLYLNDLDAGPLDVPRGSRVTVRLYGDVGALSVLETVSGADEDVVDPAATEEVFQVRQAGTIEVVGRNGRAWQVSVLTDVAPEIEVEGPAERTAQGELRQPFRAADDYGVVSGRARIALDLGKVDRRHGLTAEPERREPIVLDLPLPIAGDRAEFDETLIGQFAQHPWAGLPVTLSLTAVDAAGQEGQSPHESLVLPERRFFDPLAAAIVEQRRDLLWTRDNAVRVAQLLRAVSWRPEDIFRSETAYLRLRVAIRRLETFDRYDQLTPERRDEIAQALWDVAVEIEEGDLSDALERLRRAQDRLSEAMRNGATDEEIAELMQELREAMQDYMRQLAEQAQDQDQQMAQGDMQQITGDQLQQMLDRLQELMEQGRMAEAQQLLDQLARMMENMQVAQGQPGQQGQSQGQQAMDGLAETLRQQQGLNDETFEDLQQQFGDGPGQQGQQGQQGQGQGQQFGQGQQPGQQGQGSRPGQGQPQTGQGPGGQQPGSGPGQSLADRQQMLRDELARQQGNMPGAGTPDGDAAREALDRAGRAMEGAEEALRQDDYAGALDQQSQAMEALREGMRELGEQMAQQQQGQGGQGEAMGQVGDGVRRDPLGRALGSQGRIGTDEQLLQGEDVYRRARELLDEIRRRSGDQSRPDEELDYLRRLLDRF